MASIITGIIFWFLVAYIVLSFFGTVIIASIIDEQDHEEPIALALKAAAIVTMPLSIWVYGYLLKKKIAEKKDKKKAIELKRKVKEFVAFLPNDTKWALGLRGEIDEKEFESNLIYGLTRYGENNYYGVFLGINNYEIELLERLSVQNVEEWHYKRYKIIEVFRKFREIIERHYGNDKATRN